LLSGGKTAYSLESSSRMSTEELLSFGIKTGGEDAKRKWGGGGGGGLGGGGGGVGGVGVVGVKWGVVWVGWWGGGFVCVYVWGGGSVLLGRVWG